MRSTTRDEASRYVYSRLADPRFQRRIAFAAPDGTRPITVGLPDDPLGDVLAQVVKAGGASNVVLVRDTESEPTVFALMTSHF